MDTKYYFSPNIHDDTKRYEISTSEIFKPNLAMLSPADKQKTQDVQRLVI